MCTVVPIVDTVVHACCSNTCKIVQAYTSSVRLRVWSCKNYQSPSGELEYSNVCGTAAGVERCTGRPEATTSLPLLGLCKISVQILARYVHIVHNAAHDVHVFLSYVYRPFCQFSSFSPK